jgi:hypothetical protein
MSAENQAVRGNGGFLPAHLRNTGILFSWIAALLLVGGLFWFLTQPLRSRVLLRSVNRVLSAAGDSRRLGTAVSPWGLPGRVSQLGAWFTVVDSESGAVVFPMVIEGAPVSFLVIVSPEQGVDLLLPLSGNPERTLKQMPQTTLRIYTRRAETAYTLLRDSMSGETSRGKTRK